MNKSVVAKAMQGRKGGSSDHKRVMRGIFMIELFRILTMVDATQIYIFNNLHRNKCIQTNTHKLVNVKLVKSEYGI